MRVLLITQLFDPENAIKGLSFCRGLQAQGHEVVVLTTFPSYPGGRLYPGFKMKARQVEYSDGVRVIRLPSYISHGRSSLKRLLSYASFSFAAFLQACFMPRADVVYCYYPPLLGGIAGVFVKKIKRSRLIYDVQDLWPEAVSATGMLRNERLFRFLDRMVSFVYRNSDAIVTLSDGYKDAIVTKGVAYGKVHRIYNWCDESRISRVDPAAGEVGEFDILYAGNIGTAQALSAVVDAAAILQQSGNSQVRFVFLGDGVEKDLLRQKVETAGLSNVVFKDRVTPEKVGEELAKASALLVHLARSPVFDITVPQKTQAYLAAGKPLLMAVGGESAAIVTRAGAGVVATPCDPVDIAQKALVMSRKSPAELAEYGGNGLRFYQDFMSQDHGIAQVSELINTLCGKRTEVPDGL